MMVMMGLVVSLVSFKAAELNLKIEGLTAASLINHHFSFVTFFLTPLNWV
jgi:hypothetical protein